MTTATGEGQKRGFSGFGIFMQEIYSDPRKRAALEKAAGLGTGLGSRGKAMGKMWRKLPNEEKNRLNKISAQRASEQRRGQVEKRMKRLEKAKGQGGNVTTYYPSSKYVLPPTSSKKASTGKTMSPLLQRLKPVFQEWNSAMEDQRKRRRKTLIQK